ncbi:MAG: DUF4493 domain-containing protein [Bacteroides sp.]|nr:DUF4493 domain-containing protein [Bacteroides sp.]
MKKCFRGLLLVGALALLPSCSNEEGFTNSGTEGKLTLDLASDGRVLMSTRADDSMVSDVPKPEQFAVSLEKQDGSLTKKWVNVDAFNRETGFPIGTYTISATYGDMEQEGFGLPYFSATQDVLVEAGTESRIALNATLANAMVSIRYKDEFTSRFSAYSATLKSASSATEVAFAQNEDRPAYMKPEVIEMRLSLTNTQGKEVTVSPFSFTASPRFHYIVYVGVNDTNGSGDIKLDVQITEEVETEFVEISLGDDLFNAPAPSVRAYDFPADMNFEGFEGFIPENDPRVDVLAYGGMRKVNVNVETANELPFGKSVQLVGADAATQANVAKSGLVAEGFFRNPDKAGVIKFKDFLSLLPKGTYTVSIDAEDARTLVSDPVKFTVTVNTVDVKMEMVKAPEFMGEEMTVSVTTNNPDLKDALRFRVANDNGSMVDAEILESPAAVRTRATEYTFNYRISVPALTIDKIKAEVLFGIDNKVMAAIEEKGLVFPEYDVEVDAFAHKAWFKVTAKDPSKQEVVFDNFKLIKGGTSAGSFLSVLNKEEGIYELTNLEAATSYTDYSSSLGKDDIKENPKQDIAAFTTESAPDVPNGDFSASTETINIANVQVGGQWKVSPATYTTTSSIVRSTPNGWATKNDLTCWKDAKNMNTWFVVPSTFDDNGCVVIRTVGYNHDGKSPATSGGAFNTKYYCENVPADADLQKAAGELFLGSYSFDGSEHRNDGINWSSRPYSVSFDYRYTPVHGEEGEAYVRVLDTAGDVLAEGTLNMSTSEDGKGEIILAGYPFGKKAGSLEICFRSTKRDLNPYVEIPGTDIIKRDADGISNLLDTSQRKKTANNYYAVAVGSVLTIDNVKLNYDAPSQNARKRAAKVVKK